MRRNFVFGCVLVFCFHAKSATRNYHLNGSKDKSSYSFFSCLNDIKDIQFFFSVLREIGLNFFIFGLLSSEYTERAWIFCISNKTNYHKKIIEIGIIIKFFSRDSNDIQSFLCVEKNTFQIFEFNSSFELVK